MCCGSKCYFENTVGPNDDLGCCEATGWDRAWADLHGTSICFVGGSSLEAPYTQQEREESAALFQQWRKDNAYYKRKHPTDRVGGTAT